MSYGLKTLLEVHYQIIFLTCSMFNYLLARHLT